MAEQIDCTCRGCGATFQLAASDVARGRGQFCSRVCGARHGQQARWATQKESISERYERYVVRRGDEECWGWTGFKHRGYGRLRDTTRKAGPAVGAHRVSYEKHIGPIPEGMTVLHRCDNPECSNPRHLFLGTNADNNADRNAKGRQAAGERHASAVLTEEDVRTIRASAEPGTVLAARYGVTKSTIYGIKKHRSWWHL